MKVRAALISALVFFGVQTLTSQTAEKNMSPTDQTAQRPASTGETKALLQQKKKYLERLRCQVKRSPILAYLTALNIDLKGSECEASRGLGLRCHTCLTPRANSLRPAFDYID